MENNKEELKVLTIRMSKNDLERLDWVCRNKYRVKSKAHAIRLLIEDGAKGRENANV